MESFGKAINRRVSALFESSTIFDDIDNLLYKDIEEKVKNNKKLVKRKNMNGDTILMYLAKKYYDYGNIYTYRYQNRYIGYDLIPINDKEFMLMKIMELMYFLVDNGADIYEKNNFGLCTLDVLNDEFGENMERHYNDIQNGYNIVINSKYLQEIKEEKKEETRNMKT